MGKVTFFFFFYFLFSKIQGLSFDVRVIWGLCHFSLKFQKIKNDFFPSARYWMLHGAGGGGGGVGIKKPTFLPAGLSSSSLVSIFILWLIFFFFGRPRRRKQNECSKKKKLSSFFSFAVSLSLFQSKVQINVFFFLLKNVNSRRFVKAEGKRRIFFFGFGVGGSWFSPIPLSFALCLCLSLSLCVRVHKKNGS